MTDAPQPPQETPVRQKRAAALRKRHFAQAVATGLAGLMVALLFGFFLLIGRDVSAPPWLQERIEEKIALTLPGVNVGLGQMSLRVEPSDLSPRVFFQNVTVSEDTGLPFATLGELSIRASFRAAMQGQFLPKKISLSGALLRLRRSSDGTFDFTIGSALQASGEGASLLALVERLDQLLVQPELEYLREVSAESLTLLYEDARAGQAWTVDGGRVRVTQDDGLLTIGADFALLGGQDYATTLELNYDSEIGSPSARIGILLEDAPARDIATQIEAMAWMKALRAPISGALRTEVDDEGELGPLNATLQIGKGVVQPEMEAKPVPFDGAQAYFTFDPSDNSLEFSELTVKSAWLEARGEGRARLQNAPGGWPEALLGQFRLSSVAANPSQLYENPVTLDQADLDMRIVFDPFRLEIGQLVLREDGETLVASGRADIGMQGWRVAVDARARALEIGKILNVWPDVAKPKTRTWIEQNILKGTLEDVRLAFRAVPDTAPDLHLNFAYKDASLRFIKTLPVITDGRGYVRIEGARFLAASEAGTVTPPQGGKIDIAGTVFEIPDMRIKGAPANVSLRTNSTVTAALSLLDQDPFNFLSKAGQSVTLADGRAAVSGAIDFALKKNVPVSEILFDLEGDITGVRSETLVANRVLASDRLALRATSKEITLAGSARIDAVPAKGTWRLPLGTPGAASQFTGEVELSERFVDTFNIGLPPGAISGKGSGDITIDLPPQAAPNFALTSNLQGVGVVIEPLGYRKSPSARASLAVRGRLGGAKTGPPEVERLSYEAADLDISGSVKINENATLARAQFDRIRAGSWLDAPVTLIGRGRDIAPQISLAGGDLDLRNMPSFNANNNSGAVPLSITLDRLQVSKDIVLRNFTGEFQSNKGLTGEFQGRLNGKSRISGRTVPRGGKTAVQIKSANAGATIGDAGLLKNAAEGALTLSLSPRARPGEYDGTLEITNIRLRDAPASLAILSAASGIGLLEQMDGRGLMFSEVSSTFRLTPQAVIISEGSAVGPSLGLSVDGYYDVLRKRMDLQGVISPFFAINGIGAILTRRGEGLIGFNFTADGPVAAPNVNVNPLSLFTPGMFREIFRRPPPELSQ